MKKLSTMILSSAIAFTCMAPVVAFADTTNHVTYTVQSGDSLWKISQKYNVQVSDIASLNNITNMNNITVGEALNLPFVNYTVQSGDSLWKISQNYNTTVAAITKENNITDPSTVYPGQVLLIPVQQQQTISSSSTPSTPAPSTTSQKPSTSPSTNTNARDVLANNIVTTAEKYLGVPYVWGGTSPSGFDCSGFTFYVFQQNGITLPRVSRDQFNVGITISLDQLQKGDLVFFDDTWTTGISHVGIYIGNGQFIEESSGQGKAIISTMSNPYWTTHYAGARRVF